MGRRCLILALTALLLTGCAGSPGQSAAALAQGAGTAGEQQRRLAVPAPRASLRRRWPRRRATGS